jgi:predicted regulator of Ras-like GTPase activity (Roadblock/LC7/MglB family)
MFSEMLDQVLHATPGALSVTLMGFDGIEIDSRQASDPGTVDHQTTAIELGAIASQLKRVSDSMGTGDVDEMTVRTGAVTTVMRLLTDEYFVALSLAPEGNFGKGRYLLRVLAPKLQAELV